MFDLEVTLLHQDGYTENKVGDKVPLYKDIEIFAKELPISRSEYYFAGQANIEVSRLIVIHPFEYGNEKILKIEGEQYSVIKQYKVDNEHLELTLKQKVGNK